MRSRVTEACVGGWAPGDADDEWCVRQRQKTLMRSLYIQGLASVLDRFVLFTNQLGVDVY